MKIERRERKGHLMETSEGKKRDELRNHYRAGCREENAQELRSLER
jgi:hypothetical protein